MIRDRDGTIRELLAHGALFDVSDPAVSFDGRTLLFAGVVHPDSGWRIFRARADGGRLAAVTKTLPLDRMRSRRPYDDLDPCWISDSVFCFASTRGGERAQYADLPVTNLHLATIDGRDLGRITADRNGAEEPTLDPRTGDIVYARWWFNRFRAARDRGVTDDPALALPGDSVNLWQAIEIAPDGSALRLAGGAIGSRLETMAYQPAFLPDGTMLGVYASNLGLVPRPGGAGIQAFPGRYGRARRIVGALIDESRASAYGNPRGLAIPSACSPAALPDGRVLFAYDPGARGDFGIYSASARGENVERVVDLRGTLELDPVPLVSRPRPRVRGVHFANLDQPGATFTYLERNVFANGPVDSPVPSGPAIARDLRLRFYALRSTDRSAGDRALLIREVPVDARGGIRAEGLPAGEPMFEQLVDAHGRAVMTAHGPAHVAGANFGVPGGTSRCVGCHLGHSTLAADASDESVRWFDAAPSAEVTASSVASGGAGPRAAVDRRARGAPNQVAWIAGEKRDQWLDLAWPSPLMVREVVLHGEGATAVAGDLILFRGPVEVARRKWRGSLARLSLAAVACDRIRIEFAASERAPAIAEIEAIARLP
jgi:hypothetical protein